jgi:hypothetical protein
MPSDFEPLHVFVEQFDRESTGEYFTYGSPPRYRAFTGVADEAATYLKTYAQADTVTARGLSKVLNARCTECDAPARYVRQRRGKIVFARCGECQ